MRWASLAILFACLLPAAVAQRARHAVVIGVDGLGGQMAARGRMRAVTMLCQRGAWTFHARGVLPTVSSPNWASVIGGAGPELHGVLNNDWQPDSVAIPPACTLQPGRWPTMFGVVRAAHSQAKIAIVHDWDGFARLVEPGVASLVRHEEGSPATTRAAIEVWKALRPELLFVHLDDLDHAGHGKGWDSTFYDQEMTVIDAFIGRIVNAIDATGDTAGTLVIVTGDHGGTGTRHGQPVLRELEIPWVAAGPGVPHGEELHRPVNATDTAATVVQALGVEPHPCWTGRSVFSFQ
jgi:predicted AlkP superfamily pyrophosphatase or phosphodiesterase